MSEIIDIRSNRKPMHQQLLASASTLALIGYVISATVAKAADADTSRPTVWIDLGGQMELLQGSSSPFEAPFMLLSPTPGPYKQDSLIDTQHGARHAFGLEGKITFQPEDSDWIFSAGVRYGRSQVNRHVHHQSPAVTGLISIPILGNSQQIPLYAAAFADTKMVEEESHTVLDFNVGRDVGVGALGHEGMSSISAGVRFAQFSSKSNTSIYARPTVGLGTITQLGLIHKQGATFYQYNMSGHSRRSFRGIGPSLSWNASAAIIGNGEDGELTFDWGINAAILFGRQKAQTDHSTQTYHRAVVSNALVYQQLPLQTGHSTRSRAVIVPNLGGFAGISVKYPNAKISLGYRADFFFSAADTGIDVRDTKDLGFNGPFATVSIGLGG